MPHCQEIYLSEAISKSGDGSCLTNKTVVGLMTSAFHSTERC